MTLAGMLQNLYQAVFIFSTPARVIQVCLNLFSK